MSVNLSDTANRTPIFSNTYKIAQKVRSKLTSLFSTPSALLRTLRKLIFPPNPFVLCRLRTLSDNYRGWGVSSHLSKHLSLSCTHFRKNTLSKPFIFNPLQKSAQVTENTRFQVPLFSYSCALFSRKSFFCLTYAKQRGGYTQNCPILGFSAHSRSPLLPPPGNQPTRARPQNSLARKSKWPAPLAAEKSTRWREYEG